MIESLVYDALKHLAGARVFPDVAPGETARPYITFQAVGGQAVNFTDRTAPSKQNARMQINVWADSRLAASELGAQVEGALRAASTMQTEVIGARVATYDEETQLRGTRQDFSIWADN